MNITFQANPTTVLEWEVANLKAAMISLAFLQSLPQICGACYSTVHFHYHEAKPKEGKNAGKSFHYYGLECDGNPSHQLIFHEYADQTRGFYITPADKWENSFNPANDAGNQDSPNVERMSAALITESATKLAKNILALNDKKSWVVSDNTVTVDTDKVAHCDCRHYRAFGDCEHIQACKIFFRSKTNNS